MNTAATDNSGRNESPATKAGYLFYAAGVLFAFACAAVLIAASPVRAQAVTSPEPAIAADPAPPAGTAGLKASPRYSAKDIERAFGFIDANKDNLISREEASGFRNVAKYFDAADVNKDGALSVDEFGAALNKP